MSSRKTDYWSDELGQEITAPTTISVIENHDIVDTGVLDQFGRPVYRTVERVKIGFHRR